MDLLEYQGKQLFARHGIPVPTGRPAVTVDEAVDAADSIGYPCVVKAQVQIGGRGKLGGIKVAASSDEVREHAGAILGMDIRGLRVHEVWIEAASEIEAEYYASIVFDRSAKAPYVISLHQGRHGHRGGGRGGPRRDRVPARRPAAGLPGLPRPAARLRGRRRRRPGAPDHRDAGQAVRRLRGRGRDAGRGQPADRHARARAAGAGRQGHPRRQRAVPPPRERRAARSVRGGPAGADGQGARPDLRQARRRHRHPRQRGRAGDVDARRRGPGRRPAGELPRRGRRLEGGRHRGRRRGDPLQREGPGGALQHLRRHHPLRRGGQGPDRGLRPGAAGGAVRRAPGRHQRRGGAPAAGRTPRCPTCTSRRTMLGAARRVVELAAATPSEAR